MIPKKRVSSGNCLHLRLELDSTNNGFQRAQRYFNLRFGDSELAFTCQEPPKQDRLKRMLGKSLLHTELVRDCFMTKAHDRTSWNQTFL
jgi:hypothetical protein